MPVDDDAMYSTYSGAQLLEALESIDRARYPKNYANLRREIAGRPAPGPSVVEGGEVIELARLTRKEIRALLTRVVIALFLLELAGAILGTFAAVPFLMMIVGLAMSNHASLAAIVGFVVEVALYVGMAVGIAWAFLKWLLQKKKGQYYIRLIRPQASDT